MPTLVNSNNNTRALDPTVPTATRVYKASPRKLRRFRLKTKQCTTIEDWGENAVKILNPSEARGRETQHTVRGTARTDGTATRGDRKAFLVRGAISPGHRITKRGLSSLVTAQAVTVLRLALNAMRSTTQPRSRPTNQEHSSPDTSTNEPELKETGGRGGGEWQQGKISSIAHRSDRVGKAPALTW